MGIADEKYVALTTYRRNGEPKSLPVWIVDLGDGTLGFTTASSSHKVKRLDNDDRVVIQPSDSRGNTTDGSTAYSGTAEVLMGADFERVRDRVKSKYGIQYRLITMVGRVARMFGKGSGTDTAVVISLDD